MTFMAFVFSGGIAVTYTSANCFCKKQLALVVFVKQLVLQKQAVFVKWTVKYLKKFPHQLAGLKHPALIMRRAVKHLHASKPVWQVAQILVQSPFLKMETLQERQGD